MLKLLSSNSLADFKPIILAFFLSGLALALAGQQRLVQGSQITYFSCSEVGAFDVVDAPVIPCPRPTEITRVEDVARFVGKDLAEGERLVLGDANRYVAISVRRQIAGPK